MRRHESLTRATRTLCLASTAALLAVEAPTAAVQKTEARHVELLPLKSAHIARAIGAGRSELGLSGSKVPIVMKTIDGRSCAVGNLVAFDVNDAYAFDIDEPVSVSITYAPELTQPFKIAWDRNGGEGYGLSDEIAPEPGARFRTTEATLTRARFSGQGIQRTDFAIGGPGGVALCDVAVTRRAAPKPSTALTPVHIDVVDAATGRPIPVRMGLYDQTGRTPLPSASASMLHRFADQVRLQWLNARAWWPSPNRQVFYVNGSYDARVPAGAYDLVVSRGPEFRIHRETIAVRVGERATVRVGLQRYADLPAQGWFSGESHIHHLRDRADDLDVWTMVAGEDLHVGNLLEMGNIAGTHFKQPAWGAAGRFERDGYALVPGQEDPRTGVRGHTIHWNLQQHTHVEPQSFFKYHEIFERTRRQGSLVGYAHLGQSFHAQRGLALDVPFGLIDFIEVLQGGRLNTEVWYSFLNLGFKVLPVGGADWPYFGPTQPGVERTYVNIDGRFSADAWFAAFRQGRAYVSNGPFLQLTVNGKPMGSELHVARGTPLEIVAAAQLNPDVDRLDRLEIVSLGEVVTSQPAGGRDRTGVRTTIIADKSMWLAVRAYGAHQEPQYTTIAHSAPVYVVVDDRPFWKAEAVSQLVALHRRQLDDLLTEPVNPMEDNEPWDTEEVLVAQWQQQRPLLAPRIKEADARYQKLLQVFSENGP